jgi:hypothetical protein
MNSCIAAYQQALPKTFAGHQLVHAAYKLASQISEREGELPAIPESHRALIEGYLCGKASLKEVFDKDEITRSNVKEFLKSVKVVDLEFDRLSREEKIEKKYSESSYALRTVCAQLSEGRIHTFEAYTRSINPIYFADPWSKEAQEYANEPSNYIPQRQREHVKIVEDLAIEMMALSRRLGPEKRTIFCLAGNMAVGKTSTAKRDPEFAKGLVEGKMVGVLAPDLVKDCLKKGVPKISSFQVHIEGCLLETRLATELKEKAVETSIVIDRRLGAKDCLSPLLNVASDTGKKVQYKDIDADLMVSAMRVLGRDVAKDPCPPFESVAYGFKIARQNRREIIEIMRSKDVVEKYELYSTGPQGEKVLVAEKSQGKWVVANEREFAQVTKPPQDQEIDQVAKIVIDAALLEKYRDFPGVKTKALQAYQGMTIEDALDQHSHELPPGDIFA